MTLSEIKFLHAYNSWANTRIFDALGSLPAELYTRDLHASHGSIHGTLTHLVASQKVWLSRWMRSNDEQFLNPADVPGLAELRTIWERTGFDTAKFLGTMTDRKLQESFTMTTTKGVTSTHLYWQTFQHMVDHSSYHRGQIVAMMRQLGLQPPVTGLIHFYRETATRT